MQLITTLRDETRQLLLNRPVHLEYKTIGKKIGKSTRWLTMLSAGELTDPGVCTIETLNAFLKQEIKKAAKNV